MEQSVALHEHHQQHPDPQKWPRPVVQSTPVGVDKHGAEVRAWTFNTGGRQN